MVPSHLPRPERLRDRNESGSGWSGTASRRYTATRSRRTGRRLSGRAATSATRLQSARLLCVAALLWTLPLRLLRLRSLLRRRLRLLRSPSLVSHAVAWFFQPDLSQEFDSPFVCDCGQQVHPPASTVAWQWVERHDTARDQTPKSRNRCGARSHLGDARRERFQAVAEAAAFGWN